LNRASFPISITLVAAKTVIEGLEPPRAKFPKPSFIIHPGTSVWIHDDPIVMNNMDCDDLDGSIDMTIKYGLPGDEKFEMTYKGTVEIFMETYGFLKGIYFHPESSGLETAIPSHNVGN
jgi:hypothetical protein